MLASGVRAGVGSQRLKHKTEVGWKVGPWRRIEVLPPAEGAWMTGREEQPVSTVRLSPGAPEVGQALPGPV